ncbi:MAG: hypothetical protein DRQ78_13295 [Epsilonproteobacteria bacterium]|nr:MAG: hypothetical protein DRQ78_13295 [Campylobacterota bacterium]
MEFLILAVGIVLFVLGSLWLYISYKKKLLKITDELKFFKKEKDYYAEVMLVLSQDGDILFSNQAAKTLFALNKKNEIIDTNKKIVLRISTNPPEDFFTAIQNMDLSTENDIKLDNAVLIVSGRVKKANIYIDKCIWKNNKTITCVIDMNLENQTNSVTNKTELLGTIDFLTGLPSQFSALSDINSHIIESKKKSESFSLFLLGIDHFHDIQTTLGLGYTNRILKTLSQYFNENLDEKIIVYRMESDKFLLFVKYSNSDGKVHARARDLIISVSNIYRDNNDIRLTSSVGIVQYPEDAANATKLIDNVYIALSKAQEHSESNVAQFNADEQSIHLNEVKMNEEIHNGLKNNEFLLFYQPIFDLKGERIIGAEALIRWEHPKHGLITADKFVDIAGKTGLIVDLGEYAFNEAIQERKRCNTGYVQDFQITINLSLKEMKVEKLIPKLEMLFNKYKVDRNAINLDISESAAMENIDKAARDFKLLKDFGLSLSLDHFGEGCSSFKYLAMLPLNRIKIDRTLIFDLALNLQHQTTVRAIIDFAHTLGFEVIAEGVETSEVATILKTLKCDYAQGYLYSKPLPAAEFEELLK